MKKTIIAAILIAVSTQVIARNYPDSVRIAGEAQTRIHKGLSLEVSGGLGVSRIDFQHWGQKGNNAFINNHLRQDPQFPSGNAAVGLQYYFVPCFGLGTGVQFSNYLSKTTFDAPWVFNGVDKYGDAYTQTVTTHAAEIQQMYMLEIPIGLHFRAIGETKKVGFIGALGVKLGLPLKGTYKMKDAANISNNIYYPIYDLQIRDIPTVIEDGIIPAYSDECLLSTLNNGTRQPIMALFNVAGFAQAGVLFQLTKRIDMSVTAFADYYINDVVAYRSSEAICFGLDLPKGEYASPLSNERQSVGFINTNTVSSVHPWNAGLKIGFHFNTGKTDAQRAYDKEQREKRRAARLAAEQARLAAADSLANLPPVIAPAPLPKTEEDTLTPELPTAPVRNCDCIDTIYIYVHDTIYINTAHQQAQAPVDAVTQITEAMEKSIIWFDLDSDKPILEPKDILINIAAILKAHPEQRVYVNGHACLLGKPAYNMDLAMRRAKAVAKQLITLGVNADQLVVQTKGANEPYKFNGAHTLEKDRRVEIIPIEESTLPAEPTMSEPEVQAAPAAPKAKVVIQSGDRLSKLARQYYGNTADWTKIYEANKNVIKNPDILPVGETIVIP